MIHKSNLAKLIFSLLDQLGLQHAVVGGYPRDLRHGRTVKDMDIVVFGVQNRNCVSQMSKVLQSVEVLTDEFLEGASCTGVEEVLDVLKVGDIDIIFYNQQFETLEDVFSTFDYNMNMFSLNVTHDYVKFHGTERGKLVLVSPQRVREARELHMLDVATQINWDTAETERITNSNTTL